MRKLCLRCGSKFVSDAQFCPHDGSLLVTDHDIPDPLLGTVLLEQFRIDERIGTGGMGTVYRAHQTTVGRDVAIKVLRQELARDDQAVARFEREGRLAIALDHPNLVRVFLTGRLGDGRLYIVMELLAGRTLAEELERLGPPSVERAVILLMKLCAALGAVHAAGVVHRDIKPENVYLVRRGSDADFIKLVDFGIARVLQTGDVGPTTTQSGRVFGTATYISPEAATGDDTDHRSDIYSLGVLAYQLLTGELPFEGSTAGAVLMQHVHREPPPMRSKGRGAEVPGELCAVVMRSLRKDPDERPQSLAELLDSLAQAAGRAGLLHDARRLLLGTVWGDELAAPGTYLGDLLAPSKPPAPPAALDDTAPLAFTRDPKEEALLSSAPKPFGTTSHDLVAVPGLERTRRAWLWPALGVLVLAAVGIATATWWRGSPAALPSPVPTPDAPRLAVHGEPTLEEGEPTHEMPEAAEPVVDVATGQPPMASDARPEAQQTPTQAIEEPRPAPPQGQVKRSKTSRPAQARRPSRSAPAPAPAPAPASVPAPAPASPDPVLEPDEGIDWTVPPLPEAAPTGTPDAPPKNPIVIDEPPAR
jgi:serine/threonine protein kinase